MNKPANGLLPYSIITAAVLGNPDAVTTVINHYSCYTVSLCMRAGNGISMDWELYNRLKYRLTAALPVFRLS